MNLSVKLFAASTLCVLAAACAVDTGNEEAEGAASAPTEESEAALGFTLPVTDIPTTGAANPGFAPVDAAIRRFMRERCVGAAVIGISNNGSVIHNVGFGYKNGPPNANCATASDPFVGGEKMGPTDPIRIGSNAKAVLGAVFRKAIKQALSEKRGGAAVSDAELHALKLLDNGELTLVSPKVRTAMLDNGNLEEITNEPCVPKAWAQVTIGQLLTHTAGLSGSESAYEELSGIRNLSSPVKLAQQQNASGAPAAARADLVATQGSNTYFVPPATLEEVIEAQGNRCFSYAPGTKEVYSNGGFTLLSYVLEYVTGRNFVAPNGSPGSHFASLLSEFGATELGFGSGIEHSHTALGARDAEEPTYRWWSANQDTYYPKLNDDKRPWCRLSGSRCDFSEFRSGETRYNWNWQKKQVDHSYRSNSVAAGAGALAAEAPKYLAFMHEYTVGRPYGGARSDYPGFKQHFGGLGGTISWVAQMGGTPIGYKSFGKNRDGSMSFEPSKTTTGGSCVIPAGIDVFFAMNQSSDAKCTEANGCVACEKAGCKPEDKKNAYSDGFYNEVLKEALCSVDWSVGPQ